METEAVVNLMALLKGCAHIIYINPVIRIMMGAIIGQHVANGMILQATSKYDGCLINNNIFYDKATIDERKKNVDKEKIKVLLPYVNRLSKVVDKNLLVDMYRNLSSAKVSFNPMLVFLSAGGTYEARDNEINYLLKSFIGHELLHLSSSYYDKKSKEEHSGFSQKKGFAHIGDGLNEGYTELLASRIFNDNKVKSYKKSVRIARLIELFFDDKDDMQKYYFKHNLAGFVKYMEQFIPRKIFIRMLLDMDVMTRLDCIGFGIPTVKSISVELSLYKYFLKSNPSKEKKRAFERIIRETKLGEMALNRTKMKLMRNNMSGGRVTMATREECCSKTM